MEVYDVSSYLDDIDHQVDRMTVSTDYKFRGHNVLLVTVVETYSKEAMLHSGERMPGVRNFRDSGLYIMDRGMMRNLEDVMEGREVYVTDKDGKQVHEFVAIDAAGIEAAKASHMPHVLTRAEFDKLAPVQERALMKFYEGTGTWDGKPIESSRDDRYRRYMQRVEKEICDEHIPYIGRIKDVSEFYLRGPEYYNSKAEYEAAVPPPDEDGPFVVEDKDFGDE